MAGQKEQVMEYVSEMNQDTQRLAARAIKELRTGEDKKTWEWIKLALKHKSIEEWEQYGFGLVFNWSYQKQINNLVKIRREATAINMDTFWDEVK